MHSLSFLDRRSKPFIFAACCYIFFSKSKDAAQRILLFAPQVRRNKRKLNSILSCGSGHPQLEQAGDRARVGFPAWDLPRQLKGE